MRSGMSRRAASAGRVCVQAYTFAAAVALLPLAAGCASDGNPGYAQAGLQRPSIAFESIDGPPAPVFEKLVSDLAAEARSRQVQVVSRQSPASYRVRGYLAANVVEGRTHYEWVWDVYDADKRRTVRLGGEERGGRPGDAWASLDDFTLSLFHVAQARRVHGRLLGGACGEHGGHENDCGRRRSLHQRSPRAGGQREHYRTAPHPPLPRKRGREIASRNRYFACAFPGGPRS